MTYCAAPFVHMVHNPDGNFRTCCMFEKPFKKKYKDVFEAFNSDENNEIRYRMLSGEKLPECEKCDIDELHSGKGKISYRREFNEKYGKNYIEKPKIKTLEISVSNKCNFKCIDCGPRFSNQFGQTNVNELSEKNVYSDLDFLKILGGEPFLDKKNKELLKIVPRKNINLMIVTNNSIFPDEETLELMNEFKHLNINISIDGMDKIAEYVRYGTKWTRFEKNWKKWLEWQKDKKERCYIIPHYVVHSLNAPFFEETVQWSGIDAKWWSWDFLVNPEWLNISFLPDAVKNYILDQHVFLKKHLRIFLKTNEYNKKIIKSLLTNINTDTYPKEMDDYIEIIYNNLK